MHFATKLVAKWECLQNWHLFLGDIMLKSFQKAKRCVKLFFILIKSCKVIGAWSLPIFWRESILSMPSVPLARRTTKPGDAESRLRVIGFVAGAMGLRAKLAPGARFESQPFGFPASPGTKAP